MHYRQSQWQVCDDLISPFRMEIIAQRCARRRRWRMIREGIAHIWRAVFAAGGNLA
jgi:hypothetical protein